MRFRNTTHLCSITLERMLREASAGWPLEGLTVTVRYSRRAPYSGTCFYQTGRIFVNLGRANRYPILVPTHVARAKTDGRHWWREAYTVELADGYQLVLFVFLHELYHWLVRRAGHNVRQKEARCDRFAVRTLVDAYGVQVHNTKKRAALRDEWDFQDLDGFVARAHTRRLPTGKRAGRYSRRLPPRRTDRGSG